MRASETRRDECLTCVRGLRTGQDHPGGDQPIRSRCPSRSQTIFMSKMSESQNAWSEELEDKLVTLWQERPCLFNCTMREYSNKVVIEKPGSTGNMKSCSYIIYTLYIYMIYIYSVHIYTNTYIYMYIYMHTYTHIYIHTYTYIQGRI